MKWSWFPCSRKTEIYSMWFQTDFYALILPFFESLLLRLPFLLLLLQNATQDDYVQRFYLFYFFILDWIADMPWYSTVYCEKFLLVQGQMYIIF